MIKQVEKDLLAGKYIHTWCYKHAHMSLFIRKYIWKSHCLMFDNSRLLNDSAIVSQLGIKQNSILKFSRLAHEKGQHRKAWRH
jgi:hypothetical protein